MTTVVVVGSGPSLAGRGLGTEIDRHVVVRMHDWHWQGATDHGARNDWSVIPGPWAPARWRAQIARVPAIGWLCFWNLSQGHPKRIERELMGRPVTTFEAADVPELGPVFAGNGAPTRGLVAAVMAIELLGARRLLCAGLDAVLTGAWAGYAPELPTPDWWTPGATTTGDPTRGDRENFERDRAALAALAERRGVEVTAL